ncbi:MAG: hypothetical protein AB2535_16770 [Candidatus Thiodiazotropha endolucinida]
MATAEAQKLEVAAKGDAEAIKLRADADERRNVVESVGKKSINEAMRRQMCSVLNRLRCR